MKNKRRYFTISPLDLLKVCSAAVINHGAYRDVRIHKHGEDGFTVSLMMEDEDYLELKEKIILN